jgi:hypothetical protein
VTLTYAEMGLFCLMVLWVTALLVAWAAVQEARDVWGRLVRARRAFWGTVESTQSEVFAEWTVDQRGRALDTKDERIAFHDRRFTSKVFGGAVRIGGDVYRVEGPGEVWVSDGERARAAEQSDTVFENAYKEAVRAAGWERTVRASVGAGDVVFLMGSVAPGRISGGKEPLVVATFDPTGRFVRQLLAAASFVVGELGVCAAITAWVMVSPHFGPMCIAGAVAGLAFFLGVTPLGVALREKLESPAESALRGEWRRSAR